MIFNESDRLRRDFLEADRILRLAGTKIWRGQQYPRPRRALRILQNARVYLLEIASDEILAAREK